MAITGAVAAAVRKFDPYPGDLLALDFAGIAAGRPIYKREGVIVPRFEMLPGGISTGQGGLGTHRINGAWRGFPANAPLIGDGGLSVPEARLNKCTVVQINPANTSGIAPVAGGGVLPTISIVEDAELEALGLGGAAYRLDNTANPSSYGYAVLAGQVGSTDPHVGVVYIRGGTGDLRDNVGSGRTTFPASAIYQPRKIVWTPGAATRQLTVAAEPGQVVDFIAPNLKLGPDINDPPILQTTGLAATRTAVAQSVGVVLPPAFEVRGRFKLSVLPSAGTFRRVFSFNGGGAGDNEMCVYANSAGAVKLFSRVAGVAQADLGSRVISAGQTVDFVARFKENDFSLTVNQQAPETDLSGSLPAGLTLMQLGYAITPGGASTLNGEIANLSIREAA